MTKTDDDAREVEMRRRMADAPDPLTMIRRVADRAPDREAFVHLRTAADEEGRRFTYAEAADLTGRIAAALQNAGVKPDDGVAIISPSIPEMLFAMAAAASVAVALPLNPLLTPAALASQFAVGRVRAMIVFGHHPAIALDRMAAEAAAISGGVHLAVEIDAGHDGGLG